MYPPRFRYEAPRSIEEAIALLHQGGGEAKVLCLSLTRAVRDVDALRDLPRNEQRPRVELGLALVREHRRL
jgi:hypothetical protein